MKIHEPFACGELQSAPTDLAEVEYEFRIGSCPQMFYRIAFGVQTARNRIYGMTSDNGLDIRQATSIRGTSGGIQVSNRFKPDIKVTIA